jgi:hypothetical protein
VAGLVGRDLRLALEHGHAEAGPALERLPGDGQPDDPGADDGEVALARGIGSGVG